jgi:type III restriction enzyme
MEFKFESDQEYQMDAIKAIVDLFEGQPRIEREFQFQKAGQSTLGTVNNRMDLTDEEILKNLQTVQKRNELTPDTELFKLGEKVQTASGKRTVEFLNFSVEMETGTGKTYVYTRTIMELFKNYGYRKFIVVVPSVAIREGVIKSLKQTKKHMMALYSNTPYNVYPYDSGNLTLIRQFTFSDAIEIMVMTIAAFNKDSNIIHRTTDRLQGETPIHLVQAARPILILDEPQNLESEKSVSALAALNPIMALRYSATHRNPYNMVYRLTPWEAYRQGLVKRIEVASVLRENDVYEPYIRVSKIESAKNTVTAKIHYQKMQADGSIKEQFSICKPGASLEELSRRPEYEGYAVDEINVRDKTVRFSNGIEVEIDVELGVTKEEIFEAQLTYTIEEHFRKQLKLKKEGVKVLSLIFIDKVDNYIHPESVIRTTFNRVFNQLKQSYKDWEDKDPEKVQAAYFAKRKKKDGTEIFEDSKSGDSQKDKDVFDLIMTKKEELISFDEPVSFIFSHSALKEGWDNPNVFQICTLKQTASETRKRQEVGRGVRLCVDKDGNRLKEEKFNVLTVVANESYELFVKQLQREIVFEYQQEIEKQYGKPLDEFTIDELKEVEQKFGKGIVAPKPVNARKQTTIKSRKEFMVKPEFKQLWERIKHKTRYSVHIDSEKLIRDVIDGLKKETIKTPKIEVTKAQVYLDTGRDTFEAMRMSAAKTVVDLCGRYPLPDLVEKIKYMMENTTPRIHLTRKTVLEIFNGCSEEMKIAAMDNPHDFSYVTSRVIKEALADQLVNGIEYEKINEWYEMTQFDLEMKSWEDIVVPAEKSLYDNVRFDSNVEKEFVEGLEKRPDVLMYVKLPDWFTLPTPIGSYNPDWAIVMKNQDDDAQPLLYLVRETKGTTEIEKLQHPSEKRKVKCGKAHFVGALGVDYKIVSSIDDLP